MILFFYGPVASALHTPIQACGEIAEINMTEVYYHKELIEGTSVFVVQIAIKRIDQYVFFRSNFVPIIKAFFVVH